MKPDVRTLTAPSTTPDVVKQKLEAILTMLQAVVAGAQVSRTSYGHVSDPFGEPLTRDIGSFPPRRSKPWRDLTWNGPVAWLKAVTITFVR